MKILIVEDTEDARVLLVDQLQLHGYQTDSAANGNEALDKAKHSPPDLIISDILMPEMDGFEFCRQIKLDPQLHNLPFIFYTATYTGDQDKLFALSLGASRFVIKPENPDIFLKIIDEVLSEHATGKLPVPDKPASSNEVLEHMHAAALSKKLDKKLQELKSQKEHLQLITDAMPVLMSDIGPQYHYQYVNKSYELWYHKDRVEIIGRPMRDVIGAEAFESIRPYIDKALKGESVRFETRIPTPDNAERYILARYIPHNNQSGATTGVFELVSDISERKKVEQELQLYREKLEERVAERTAQLNASYKDLETFCYSVSHDLRAPLRSINGFSQILMEDYGETLDSKALDYFTRIRSSIIHMDRLIDDLLSLAKVSRCEINMGSVDLSELARETASLMQQNYPDRTVYCQIEDNLTAYGDTALLRVLLENLFDNAWKFTRHTSNPKIEFGHTEKDAQKVFYIRDNGAGFDMKYSHKMFGPFQRLHETHEFPGTGIGLASVLRIVQRHGGEIWAQGEAGKGATFYFTIPGPGQ